MFYITKEEFENRLKKMPFVLTAREINRQMETYHGRIIHRTKNAANRLFALIALHEDSQRIETFSDLQASDPGSYASLIEQLYECFREGAYTI
jgi:hypothetical protein